MKKDFCKTENLLGQQIFKEKLLEFTLLRNIVLIFSLLDSSILDMMKPEIGLDMSMKKIEIKQYQITNVTTQQKNNSSSF